MTIDRASCGASLDPRRRPHPALAVVLLALALALLACAGGGPGPRPAVLIVPSDSLPLPFLDVADSSAWSVPGDSVAGEALISVTDGDYRLPALAPDGRSVAYVEVARSDTAVRSRLWLRGLDADTGRVLRGYDEIDEYGVASYSPWVRKLAWRGADTLVAKISDGDVGTATVALAVPSGEVLSEGYEQGEPGPLPPAEAALRDSLVAAFPGWREEVVASALRMGQYLETGGGVLLQKRYAGEDAQVRWLEWSTGDTTLVLTMPGALERRGELRPGLAVGGRALFPLLKDDRAHLFEFRPGERLAWWGSVPTGPSHFVRLRTVARSADGTLAQLDLASGGGCCVHEPVLWITPEAVTEWTGIGTVADVDALLEHGLSAWTHWTIPDSVRALRVRRLER